MLINNVLDIWSLIDPKRIFVKPKLHLLLHLVFDIRDHGPAVLYATEIFECFNAIFRLCSVLSNHQAPSRDIALACADMDRFKHQVSGGWWRADQERFVQAGENVRQYFKNGELQRRLGYSDRSLTRPGMLMPLGNKCWRKHTIDTDTGRHRSSKEVYTKGDYLGCCFVRRGDDQCEVPAPIGVVSLLLCGSTNCRHLQGRVMGNIRVQCMPIFAILSLRY